MSDEREERASDHEPDATEYRDARDDAAHTLRWCGVLGRWRVSFPENRSDDERGPRS